jgi:predicted nucleic acid-binding protein
LAGELSSQARFAGRTVQLRDCVIAAVAVLNGCTVLTRDADFLRLNGVKVRLI